MNDTHRTLAVPATQNDPQRHDRAAEAPTDPAGDPGDAVLANSPGRPAVGQVMRPLTSTIEPSAHLAAAAYLMNHSHDSTLFVTNDDTHEPVAMITNAEITRAVAEGQNLEDTRISQVVQAKPLTVDADLAAADAARLMLSKGIRHLPVVDKGRLVGTVDLADLCQASPEARSDYGGTP